MAYLPNAIFGVASLNPSSYHTKKVITKIPIGVLLIPQGAVEPTTQLYPKRSCEMRAFVKIIPLCLALCFMSGCAQRIGAFTMTSTKVVKVNAKELGERVEGTHMVFFGTPSLQEALDKAIEKSPGADALIDVTIWYKYGFIRKGFKVIGTPVSTKQGTSSLNNDEVFVNAENVEKVFDMSQIKSE